MNHISAEKYISLHPECIIGLTFQPERRSVSMRRQTDIIRHIEHGQRLQMLDQSKDIEISEPKITIEYLKKAGGKAMLSYYTLTRLHDPLGLTPNQLTYSKEMFDAYNGLLTAIEDFTQMTIADYTNGAFEFL